MSIATTQYKVIVLLISYFCFFQACDAQVQTVFRWRDEKCWDVFIPDSPARAVLRKRDLIVLLGNSENTILAGKDFNDLKPDCLSKSVGSQNADPRKIDDRFWAQALIVVGNNRVLALASHEYMGSRHAGKCLVPQVGFYPTCWYSTITLAEGNLEPFSITQLPVENRVLAASPFRYDPSIKERSGFFTVSNVVRSGDFLYVFSYKELPEQRGNCLFRASKSQPRGPWKARLAGQFSQTFPSAFDDTTPVARNCDVIAPDVFSGPIRSVVWLSGKKMWMAVGAYTAKAGPGQEENSGVFYSLSADLVNWRPRRRLFAGRQPWGQKDCGEFYEYPSLIDHSSKSNIFDTVDGDDLYLYLTRFNYTSCKKGLDRDLVRFKVPLETISLGER